MWINKPDHNFEIEALFDEFINTVGGERVSEFVGKSPKFENADYIFEEHKIIIELKEIQTEYDKPEIIYNHLHKLLNRLSNEEANKLHESLDSQEQFLNLPEWFKIDFNKYFRPQVSRVLKKANLQIKTTKEHFKISKNNGVLFLVNDYFTGVNPLMFMAIISEILLHSYSSIDCIVFLNINRYIAIENNNVPKMLWAPLYSSKAEQDLSQFINNIGNKWYNFLTENKNLSFDEYQTAEDFTPLISSKYIKS